jgi:hypothetical protein
MDETVDVFESTKNLTDFISTSPAAGARLAAKAPTGW